MTTAMPTLQTDRLIVRPFVMDDLAAAHSVLCRAWAVPAEEQAEQLPRRERWLRWLVASYEELAHLRQPPYGDRAVVLRENGHLIGVVGFVPSIGPFGQLPGFPANQCSKCKYAEVGLYWAVDPAYQRRGYASEAGTALVAFAFDGFNLGRLVATTEHGNERSIAVMRKLGMRILRNPRREPPWFQVVGLLERRDAIFG
jgi:RimJ/RimL family protein N-acetyltransferase